MKQTGRIRLAGAAAGLVNGLFGGGGGTVLVPLLGRWGGMETRQVFATCVAVVFPACLVSAGVSLLHRHLDLIQKVPVRWLRVLFALFLLYGGGRYLL